jgi:hypothetical protein
LNESRVLTDNAEKGGTRREWYHSIGMDPSFGGTFFCWRGTCVVHATCDWWRTDVLCDYLLTVVKPKPPYSLQYYILIIYPFLLWTAGPTYTSGPLPRMRSIPFSFTKKVHHLSPFLLPPQYEGKIKTI